MRRRRATPRASVSSIVSCVGGELTEAPLHRLELAGHALLLRTERAEGSARVGERRDGGVALAERDHFGHELPDLRLVAGGAFLVTASRRERVAVERRAG